MKTLGKIILAFGLLMNLSWLAHGDTNPACTVVKTISKDLNTGRKIVATAFALSSSELVINDHSLVSANDSVQVFFSSVQKTATAQVVARDFYTDLAVLRIEPGLTLTPCELSNETRIRTMDSVLVRGFEIKEVRPFVVEGQIMNPDARKLEVPGIVSSLEIANTVVRESMSGSPVFLRGQVVGMITQRTPEMTALAIPAEAIRKIFDILRNGQVPVRAFAYNRNDGTFSFSGLQFRGSEQGINPSELLVSQGAQESPELIAADPHGGRSRPILKDPHGGRTLGPDTQNYAVSGQEKGNGYVVGRVVDLATLRAAQPEVAELFSSGSNSVILIRAIDRIPTPTLLDLIRVLGTCKVCRIDSFLVLNAQPEKLKNKYLQSVAYLGQLSAAIEKDLKPKDRQLVSELIQANVDELLALSNGLESTGALSPSSIRKAGKIWAQIEAILEKTILSDQAYDILYEIRSRNIN